MTNNTLEAFLAGKANNTARAYRQALNLWASAGSPVEKDAFAAWFYSLNHLSASTRNLYLTAVVGYIKHSELGPGIYSIRRPSAHDLIRPTKALTKLEVSAFIDDPRLMYKAGWHVLFFLGLRISELCKLDIINDISHTSEGRLVLRIRAPKDRRYRELLVPRLVAKSLTAWLQSAGAPRHGRIFPIDKGVMANAFRDRAIKLGLESIGPHTARATFITQALEEGWHPVDIMRCTGHKNVEMILRYERRRFVTKEVSYESKRDV